VSKNTLPEQKNPTRVIRERMENRIKDLIAVGASIAANCHPCLAYHLSKARQHKASESEIGEAIAVGKIVRTGAPRKMDQFMTTILADSSPGGKGCQDDCTCG